MKNFIFIIHDTVSVLVDIFKITRLTPINRSFFTFIFLPDSSSLIIPNTIRILTNKPFIGFIIRLFLSNNISILIQNIDHITIKAIYFSSI